MSRTVPRPLAVPPRRGFVGRTAQLADLEEDLAAAALHGAFRPVLVEGAAGTGKTSLLAETARRAAERGYAVRFGWAEEGLEEAYAPWRQALGGEWPTSHGREELFADVCDVLSKAAGPLLLVFDDLHWADRDSLLLLSHLAARRPVPAGLLLSAYRSSGIEDHAALTAALARLLGEPDVRRLILGPFDVEDVATLLAAGDLPDGGAVPTAAAEIHERTGGNPFFVTALLDELAGGRVEPPSASLRGAILHRVGRLGRDALEVLTAAAVLGELSCPEVLVAVSGLDRERIEEVVEAAIRDGLIDDVGRGRLGFVHVLVAEALLDGLSPERKARAHRSAAAALAGQGASVAVVAHHLLASEPSDEAERLAVVDGVTAAGKADLEAFAYDEAVIRLSEGLDRAQRWHVDAHRRCSLLLALGQAKRRAGGGDAGFSVLLDALELTVDLHRWDDSIATIHDFPFLPSLRPDPSLSRVLTRLLAEAPASAHGARAAALSLASWTCHYSALARSRELAEEAVAEARRSGDHTALDVARAAELLAGLGEPDPRRQLALLDQAEAGDVGDQHAAGVRILLVALRAHHLLRLGDVDAFGLYVSETAAAAERIPRPELRWHACIWQSTRALLDGRFDEAIRLAQRAAGTNSGVGEATNQWVLGAAMTTAAYFRGEVDVLADLVGGLASQFPHPAARGIAVAALAAAERFSEARAQFDDLAADDWVALPRDELTIYAACLLADVCVSLNARKEGAALYRWLQPYQNQFAVLSPASVACLGAVDRSLGVLAVLAHDRERAVRHLQAAATLNARVGARPALALTLADLAALGVGEAVVEAREIADALGLTGVLRRLDELDLNRRGILERHGDTWLVGVGGQTRSVRHVLGLDYLRVLLARPHEPVHVLVLQGGMAGSDEVLDHEAKLAYRERLARIEEEREEADERGDAGRADALEEERRAIARELARALGLGGRGRHLGSEAERARVNVTRALRLAIDRVGKAVPDLGAHLRRAVTTGTRCSYSPPSGEEIRWTV